MAEKVISAPPACAAPRVVVCDGAAFDQAAANISEARGVADLVFVLASTGDIEGLCDDTIGNVAGLVFERLATAHEALLTPAAIPHHLAACAPELLGELRYLRDCIEAGRDPAMGRVNRAILRAEGGEQ